MASTQPKRKNPRLASGRKRARQNVALNAANKSLRSRYRTSVKAVEKAIQAGDRDAARTAFVAMQSVVDNVAEASGRPVRVIPLYVESLGPDGSSADTYQGMMLTDARRIAGALAP